VIIAGYGIASMPGILIDANVAHAGALPRKASPDAWWLKMGPMLVPRVIQNEGKAASV
jgi:hypothetical protein